MRGQAARACAGLPASEGPRYYNARWYDAGTGRFISEDPVLDGTLWFAYVNNNPMTLVDPWGLRAEDDVGDGRVYDEERDTYYNSDGSVSSNQSDTEMGDDDICSSEETSTSGTSSSSGSPTANRDDKAGVPVPFGQQSWGYGYDIPKIKTVPSTGNAFLDQLLAGAAGSANLLSGLASFLSTATGLAASTVYGAVESSYNEGTERLLGAQGFSGEGFARDAELVALFFTTNPGAAEAVASFLQALGRTYVTEGIAANPPRGLNIPANPGAVLPQREIGNFIGAPRQVLLTDGDVLYGIRDSGSRNVWWTRTKPRGELQWRIDQAVKPEWNRGTQLETLTIPRGSGLIGFEAPARGQGSYLLGGGNQVYIPGVPSEWSTIQPWP